MPNRRKPIDDSLIRKLRDEGLSLRKIGEKVGLSTVGVFKRLRRMLPRPFDKLTPKQKAYVAARVQGKSVTQSALEAFDCKDRASAKTIGYRLEKEPNIQACFADLLAAEGLDRSTRIRRLKQCIFHDDANVALKGLEQSWKLDGYKSSEEKEKPIIYISSEKLMILNQVEKLIKEYEEEQKKLKEEQQNQAIETQ